MAEHYDQREALHAVRQPVPTFRERCRKESTANVIFLLQLPYWIPTGFPYSDDGDYGHDGEGVLLGDTDERGFWTPRKDAEYLSDEELHDMETADGVPCAILTHRTERVFLSREEANEWARNNRHNLRDGYSVYGVPAMGRLAELLEGT